MDTPQLIVALVSAFGGGTALMAVVKGVIRWLSGRTTREQIKKTDIETQRSNAIIARDKAEEERDQADHRRWESDEYVSMLRSQLLENGIKPVDRPKHKELK